GDRGGAVAAVGGLELGPGAQAIPVPPSGKSLADQIYGLRSFAPEVRASQRESGVEDLPRAPAPPQEPAQRSEKDEGEQRRSDGVARAARDRRRALLDHGRQRCSCALRGRCRFVKDRLDGGVESETDPPDRTQRAAA